MPPIKVRSGKKYDDIELSTDESALVFKTQIFTLTGVPPERQKILIKGGLLKDETDVDKLGIKEGQIFMVMGTAGDLPKAPEKPILFVEDMTDTQLAEALQLPARLQNLGQYHWCRRRREPTASMRDLFKQLGKTTEGSQPLVFLQMLRRNFPQFAQTSQGGIFTQQDAEECWGEVVSVLKAKLPPLEGTQDGFVDKYMSSEIVTTLKELFTKLDCHIIIETNHMQNGIWDTLKQEIQKNSPTQGRSALYLKTSRVSRLPQYLTIHFIRFFWKPAERVRAKIMRKVKFPLEFDAHQLCTPELQQRTAKARNKLQEIENERANKRPAAAPGEASTATTDLDASETKVDSTQFVDPELAKDNGANVFAQYELCAVLTHVGRSAESGHYIGWAKRADNECIKYDDDKVSIVCEEDVQKLDGGGDWHMAYICLYRAKKLE
ncbi:hypothetical protein BC938DRAFT_474570 [Jimgerdemannia flammicorona]|uniref:ubiquitinyl hydrolase 1 n=1 Tax=Jimgerdemannia flammicorona TaxID=994334 RepID=A0A433Q1Y0_9FUNG|nr:hypothetical protein BC938DRAFT_474570 [Jimgerdemannia flammicorona]